MEVRRDAADEKPGLYQVTGVFTKTGKPVPPRQGDANA